MEKRNAYVYGSLAPKLPERVERPIEKKRVQQQQVLKPIPNERIIPKAKMILGVLFVVALAFVIIYRFSAIAELNYQMGILNDQYNQLRDDNRKLEVEIETSINLNRVKEIAETKLGMHKPELYQIVLVNVPKNNYSVVVDQAYINETTKNASLVESLLGAIKSIFP